MKKYLLYAIAALIVLAGGWIVFLGPSTPTVVEIATTSENPITTSVVLSPEQPTVGSETIFTFTFTNPDGSPITDFMVHHGREVHAVLVGENLASIGHIHPQDFPELNSGNTPGVYTVAYTFPEAGRYIVAVDVMNGNGEYNKQFIINVTGTPKMQSLARDLSREKCFVGNPESGTDRYIDPVTTTRAEVNCKEGYTVTFSPSVENITAGEVVRLNYHIEKDGTPVTSLSPYLNAPIHFAIIPESFNTLLHRHGTVAGEEHSHENQMDMSEDDLDHSMEMADSLAIEDHSSMETDEHESMPMMVMDGDSSKEMAGMHHEDVPESFGPDLQSEAIVFPAPGLYQVFAQIKHNGEIIVTHFMVEVAPAFNAATARVISLDIADRTLMPNMVMLSEDEQTILRITTDEAGDFHIAGYDIEQPVTPGETKEIRFTASLPGRYNLELHPSAESDADIEIGALVVTPN